MHRVVTAVSTDTDRATRRAHSHAGDLGCTNRTLKTCGHGGTTMNQHLATKRTLSNRDQHHCRSLLPAFLMSLLLVATVGNAQMPMPTYVDLVDGGNHNILGDYLNLTPRDNSPSGQSEFLVEFDVANTGNLASGPFTIDLWAQGNKGLFWLGYTGVTSVQPGGAVRVHLIGVVTDAMQSKAFVYDNTCFAHPELFVLYWVIDAGKDVVERNEVNNEVHDYGIVVLDPWCREEDQTVVPKDIENAPELIIKEHSFAPTSVVAGRGEPVVISALVENRGGMNAGFYRVDHYACRVDNVEVTIGARYCSYLNSTSGGNGDLSFVPDLLPPNHPSGEVNTPLVPGWKYYLGWNITKLNPASWPPNDGGPFDHYGFSWENSANNKQVHWISTLQYLIAGSAVLEEEGQEYRGSLPVDRKRLRNEYRSFLPRQVYRGDYVTTRIRIRNRAELPFKGSFKVNAYMVYDDGAGLPVAYPDDYCLGTATITSLDGGAYTDVQITGQVPTEANDHTSMPYPGEYVIIWVMNGDFAGQVPQEEYRLSFGKPVYSGVE